MASFAIFLFLSLSLQSCFAMANISLGSSLTAGENSSWASSSGEFAFGFRQLNNSSNHFLLAIWLNNVPDRTIVWHANNGSNPVVPRGSKVQLTATNLVLMDSKGLAIWDVKPPATVSYAAMLDTGNLVLAGTDSVYIWQSFANPTDTILPNQTLELGNMLYSRLTDTNYSRGRFVLHFSNGNLQLNPIAWPSEFQYKSYYDSGTYNSNLSQSGYRLVFDQSANLYIAKMNREAVQIPTWTPVRYSAGNYYRATLDFDGVFTLYSHQKNSSANQAGWLPLQSIPGNICVDLINEIGSGPCGFNSYCSILESRKPTCNCPPGYEFADPNIGFSSCLPTFPQGCGLGDESINPEKLYEIKALDHVNWPLGDYERLLPHNQTECENSCLHDCLCAVAVYDGEGCWKKKLPLSNGRYGEGGFSRILVKVRKEVPVPPSFYSHEEKKQTGLKILLGSSVLFNFLLLLAASFCVLRKQKRKVKKAQDVLDLRIFETGLRIFTYQELEEATNGFREELGRGSFGIVYKGILKNGTGNVVIAVKKLDKLAKDNEREFGTEVNAIGKTHHRNLVRLLGYCYEGCQRLLIYEFMSKGTLANYLFSLPRPDWHQRVAIALGIAKALLYLHEECDFPIIHCDIKPQNILLDDNLIAKISDFGLAKLLLSNQTRTRTMIRGTRGYVAPEWFKNVPVTAKVDVYSFGVLLLEIICCRRSVEMELLEPEEEERIILTDWAYDCYVGGRLDLLVDKDMAAMGDRIRLQKWVMIAIWCIQEDPSKRPTMKMVMEMLEGFLEVPLPPSRLSFTSNWED